MNLEELPFFCVRIRVYINDTLTDQGSGTLIEDNGHFYVMTAAHCLCDKEKQQYDITSLNLNLVFAEDHVYTMNVKSIEEFDAADNVDWALIEVDKPQVDFDFSRIKRCYISKYNAKEVYGFYGFTQLEDLGAFYIVKLRGSAGNYWHVCDIPIDGQADNAHKLIDGNSGAGVFFEHAGIYYVIGYVKRLINSNGAYSDFIRYEIPLDNTVLTVASVRNIDRNILIEWQKDADKKIREHVKKQNEENMPEYISNLDRKLSVIYTDEDDKKRMMEKFENDYIEGSSHMLEMVRNGNSLYEDLNKDDDALTKRIVDNRRVTYVNEDKAEENLKEVTKVYEDYARRAFLEDNATETLATKYAAYRVAEKLMNCTIDYKQK